MKTRLLPRIGHYLRRTSPLLLVRFIAVLVLFFPVWLGILLYSILKAQFWKSPDRAREFMKKHALAFRGLDPSTLEVTMLGGGISNLSLKWTCRGEGGKLERFYVKVFLPVGTFWASISPWVSPAPPVYGSGSRHRFIVDMVSRAQLAELHVAGARLIVFDPVEHVLVTEFLDGVPLSELLKRASALSSTPAETLEIFSLCGESLGRVHAAGFSLIDIQPSNCLWVESRRQVVFIDLEFCSRQDNRAWDLAFFLGFSTVMLPQPEASHAVKAAFMEGYQKHYQPDWIDLKKKDELLAEFMPIFRTIMDLRDYTPDQLFAELFSLQNAPPSNSTGGS